MPSHYLYAIVERLPARWRPPAAGLGGASVVPRRVDDLVVLGSLLDTVPVASPRTLALHHDVVHTVLDAAAVLPVPYGLAVPSSSLLEWLAARRAVITAALGAMRGCVEMSVKLLRLDGALDQHLAARERELRELAETLAERAGLAEWRYRPSGSAGHVAASIAFLVPRGEVAPFLARIAPVASHAVGVAVVPTGPWPPYSFVPELERAPLTRMPSDARDAAGRRAG